MPFLAQNKFVMHWRALPQQPPAMARARAPTLPTTLPTQRKKSAFSWAKRERLVNHNPCLGLARQAPTVARSRAPTDDELAKLGHAAMPSGDAKAHLASTAKPSPSMSIIIRLAILTGQRRTEVAGARASELAGLDGPSPTWIIPGDVNKRGRIIEGRTKNGREQQVPLSRQAAELFQTAMRECASGEHVFPADMARVKTGATPRTPHINGESVSKAMRRIRAEAGVAEVSVHDMRRAISNWLKDQGIGREVRDSILNHVDGVRDRGALHSERPNDSTGPCGLANVGRSRLADHGSG